MKLFRIDSPFNEAMSRMFDLVALNLVFLLCCVPIVTIGASCTALHVVTMRLAAGDEPQVVKGFFRAFKSNFGQATLTWLLLLVAGGFLYVDSLIAAQMGTGGLPMKLLLGVFGILYLFILLYIFQIQGRYRNTVRRNLQNALLMAVRQLPKTVILAATVILPVLVAVYGPTAVFALCIVAFLVGGCSLIAWIQDRIMVKIFSYYDEMAEDASDRSGDLSE